MESSKRPSEVRRRVITSTYSGTVDRSRRWYTVCGKERSKGPEQGTVRGYRG